MIRGKSTDYDPAKIWKEADALEKSLVKVSRHTKKSGTQVSGYYRKRKRSK